MFPIAVDQLPKYGTARVTASCICKANSAAALGSMKRFRQDHFPECACRKFAGQKMCLLAAPTQVGGAWQLSPFPLRSSTKYHTDTQHSPT